MIETYSFTIPSLQDDTPLDCRIYHPRELHETTHALQGAIIAHPYPPLGGTQDDHVVLALTECLLDAGHIVVTFNFRGAGSSAGSNSWTGHAEVQDYISVVGLLVYYLHNLDLNYSNEAFGVLSPVLSHQELTPNGVLSFEKRESERRTIEVLLGGYSYGSLILVGLPPITAIIHTFKTAGQGTSGAEIFLRARALARQTQRTLQPARPPSTPRAHRRPGFNSSSSPVKVGGEETDPIDRRRRKSKDMHRRSLSAMREMPHRIRTHIRRHSCSSNHQTNAAGETRSPSFVIGKPQVNVRYLLVSPVLFPLTTVLLPPGLAFHKAHAAGDGNAGVFSLKYPTLLAFGDSDHFTSGKKLRQWAERLAGESAGRLKWTQIASAGHFWREDGVLDQLEAELVEWIQSG